MNFTAERKWIESELSQVADFWLKNGMDKVHGGVYTCIDKNGKVFSTDKSVWMQVSRSVREDTAIQKHSTALQTQNITA